jgi:hypothetical protein
MGPDFDLQDDGILSAGEVDKRLTTPRATAHLRWKNLRIVDGRKVGVIASLRTWPTHLLAARTTWPRIGAGRIRGRRSRRRGGLGFAPKELLVAKTDHRLEPLNLGFELGLALKGSGVLGLPVGGLTKRLEILFQPWANRTRTLRQGRSGTDRSSRRRLRRRTGLASVKFQDRNAQGSETKHGGGTVIHVG